MLGVVASKNQFVLGSNKGFGVEARKKQFGVVASKNPFGVGSNNKWIGVESRNKQFGVGSSNKQFGVGSGNKQFGVGTWNKQFGVRSGSSRFGIGSQSNPFGAWSGNTILAIGNPGNQKWKLGDQKKGVPASSWRKQKNLKFQKINIVTATKWFSSIRLLFLESNFYSFYRDCDYYTVTTLLLPSNLLACNGHWYWRLCEIFGDFWQEKLKFYTDLELRL